MSIIRQGGIHMARYQNALQTPNPAESYAYGISQYMAKEGFNIIDYKGYKVWKKGVGVLVAPQFFSIQYSENTIFLEAFIRYPILPGVYVGEMGITGAFAAIPKKMLRDRVHAVERFIMEQWHASGAAMDQQPSEQQQYPQQAYPQQYPEQQYQQQPPAQQYQQQYPAQQPYPQQQYPQQPYPQQQPTQQPYPQQQQYQQQPPAPPQQQYPKPPPSRPPSTQQQPYQPPSDNN